MQGEARRLRQKYVHLLTQLSAKVCQPNVKCLAASTVAQYLAALPADRRAALSAVRKAINENLPDGYEEGSVK